MQMKWLASGRGNGEDGKYRVEVMKGDEMHGEAEEGCRCQSSSGRSGPG